MNITINNLENINFCIIKTSKSSATKKIIFFETPYFESKLIERHLVVRTKTIIKKNFSEFTFQQSFYVIICILSYLLAFSIIIYRTNFFVDL